MYLYCFILWILVLVIIILFYGKKSNDFYSYKGSVIHHRLKTENKEEFKFKYNINMDYLNLMTLFVILLSFLIILLI